MTKLTQTLTVRGYEIDREMRIPAQTFLRWFEEARWSATTGGTAIDLAALFADGKRIVVRAQKLEILDAHLGHGAEVEVETWIARVGKTSFDFGHVARRAADGKEVARAAVVAVHLSPELQPIPVPDALRALVADGPSARATLLSGPRPAGGLELAVHVRPSDIDLLQHVNHAVYAEYFEDARALALEAPGHHHRRRASHPTRALAIEYTREARLGDSLTVITWSVPNEPTAFGFELLRAGESTPIARARIDVTEQ